MDCSSTHVSSQGIHQIFSPGRSALLVPGVVAVVAPRWPMLPGSTGVSQGFAVAVAVLSVGGSVQTQSVLPAVYGLLYTACFALAMQGLSTPLHLVLMIAMIGLSFALHLVFLPAGSTAHTAPAQRARLSSHTHTHTHAHTRTHTHTYTYTYTLHTHTYTRSIDRLLVRSGRPLLLLQSDDRKERRIDGTRQREGREGGLRRLEFVRGSGANGSFRHVHPCQARGVILAGSFSVYVR